MYLTCNLACAAEGFSKLTGKMSQVRGILARFTNTSAEEMRNTLGPEWAPFLQAPIEVES